MFQTRRQFARILLGALPATGFLSAADKRADAGEITARPNSKVGDVQIGLNVPYSFGNGGMSGDEILQKCVQLGISGLELRAQPVESFLGAPADLINPPKGASKDEVTKRLQSLREWRKSAVMSRVKEFREKYEAAGVFVGIVKVDGLAKMSEEELDYAFTLAKDLGAHAVSTELSRQEDELKRVGLFAEKHQLMVGYHNHAAVKPEHWEKAFALSNYNGANVDVGHFVAGNNTSPIPFITEHHERVTHVHVKDRKFNNGPNTPFGEGERRSRKYCD